MMTDSAMRRAVSRVGFVIEAVPTASDGHCGFLVLDGWLATPRGRVCGRTTTGCPARLGGGMRHRPP